jgi:hypothetical protein
VAAAGLIGREQLSGGLDERIGKSGWPVPAHRLLGHRAT